MASKSGVTWLTEEVAEFLASCPSAEELLTFRPSARALQRYSALLARSKTGSLSTEEEWELDQFEHIDMLVQSIKARLRPAGAWKNPWNRAWRIRFRPPMRSASCSRSRPRSTRGEARELNKAESIGMPPSDPLEPIFVHHGAKLTSIF